MDGRRGLRNGGAATAATVVSAAASIATTATAAATTVATGRVSRSRDDLACSRGLGELPVVLKRSRGVLCGAVEMLVSDHI